LLTSTLQGLHEKRQPRKAGVLNGNVKILSALIMVVHLLQGYGFMQYR